MPAATVAVLAYLDRRRQPASDSLRGRFGMPPTAVGLAVAPLAGFLAPVSIARVAPQTDLDC